MPIVEYPFIADTSWQPSWRPYLPTEFVNPGNGYGILQFSAIDSGARHCFVPFEWAREMNIILKGLCQTFLCADVEREGYKHDLRLRIFGIVPIHESNLYVPENTVIDIPKIEVVFLRELKNPKLGITGFLDKYVLILNHDRKKFSICLPKEEKPCPICRPAVKSNQDDLTIIPPSSDLF